MARLTRVLTPPPTTGPVTGPTAGPASRPVSRRSVVGGAAALAALGASGCTGGGDSGPAAAPTASVTSTDRASRAPANPDVALAAAVLRSEQAMLGRVLATARRHPGLSDSLAGARSAHRAHVALLRRADPDDASPAGTRRPGRVPTRPGRALSALARAEDRLGAAGQRDAVRARSGAFARVLASMAAASAQQAAVLSAAAGDRG